MARRLLWAGACVGAAAAWQRTELCEQLVLQDSCLAECYPELRGRPGDGFALEATALARQSNCSCEWKPQVADMLKSCHTDANVGAARVFSPGDGGISCFRIPAVLRTITGSLLAFAEARHGGCGDGSVHEIALRRSVDHGKTWSDVEFVVGGSHDFVGNPYPISMSSGEVALVYVNHSKGHGADLGSGNGVVFSSDDGVTWSQPRDISTGFGNAAGSLPGPGAGVELANSRRLLVVSHHGGYVDDYISYSDDGGTTWTTVAQAFPKMDEATLADLGDGNVLLNMRHRDEPTKGRAVARSSDGGSTWGNITFDSSLIGPVCQGSLAAFDGSVYFSNPASPSSRSHLTVRRSDDGGFTWLSKLEIQEGASAGYSSLVQGSVGDADHGGILYESTSPGSIDFATFPLALGSDPFEVVV